MPNGGIGKWICPTCGRNFARKNQFHSCELFSIKDHHFKKGTPISIEIYKKFISLFQNFGPISIESLKNIIALKKNSQFCSIQIQKKALKIIFRLFTFLSSHRFNVMSQQDQMHYYQFKIQKLDEIDEELTDWLHQAYMEN